MTLQLPWVTRRAHEAELRERDRLIDLAHSHIVNHHAAHKMEAGMFCPICTKEGYEVPAWKEISDYVARMHQETRRQQ